MADREDLDALLIGALYGELDAADRARLDTHLASHPQDRLALEGLRSTRGLLRDAQVATAMVEPPAGVSALLLQEAARRAPKAAAAGGLLGFLAGLLRPITMHPALAAAATLVLVGGTAGALYLRGGTKLAQPELPASSEVAMAPAMTPPPPPVAPSGAGSAASPAAPRRELAVDGEERARADQPSTKADLDSYRVALADEGKRGGAKEAADKDKGEVALQQPPPADLKPGAAAAADRAYLEVDPSNDNDELNVLTADGVAEQARPDPARRARAPEEQAARDSEPTDKVATAKVTKPTAAGPLGGASVAAAPSPPVASTPMAGLAAASQGTRAAPPSVVDTKVVDAPGAVAYDARTDAATLTWAKDQHARMVKLVEAGNCNQAGTLGASILRRAPDYYQDHVYNDRRVRACRSYVEKARRAADPARKVQAPAAESDLAQPVQK